MEGKKKKKIVTKKLLQVEGVMGFLPEGRRELLLFFTKLDCCCG